MKLHGNAALSWCGRRRLAERVIVEGWTLKAAAEAAVSVCAVLASGLVVTEPRRAATAETATLTTDFYGSAAATLLLRSTSV